MNIPKEAVESAAKNLYVSEHGPWDGVSGITFAHLTRARAALEAAAPHMLAGAWDEGRQAGHDHMIGKQAANPYRTAT